MNKWRCGGCGYIWDGDSAPDECPKCGAKSSEFVKLEADAANKIERARHSNMLHQDLVRLCREMESVCKDGVEDALDPGCVDVFKKGLDHCYTIMKMSMTEQAIHVKKEKWG